MAIKVVMWHGESKTLYLVVNYDVDDTTMWEVIGQCEALGLTGPGRPAEER